MVTLACGGYGTRLQARTVAWMFGCPQAELLGTLCCCSGTDTFGSQVLLRNSRKTERGAKQFLARFVVRAAPFALLGNEVF
jgi:hypothetical protein